MKLKLDEVQVEQVGVMCLTQLHQDIKEELTVNSIVPCLDDEDYVAMLRVLVSIEVILQELMQPNTYYLWKLEKGVDL